MSSKEFQIEQKVARILATHYYAGWKNKDVLMSQEEYFSASLHNWIGTARGVIAPIDRERKEEESTDS